MGGATPPAPRSPFYDRDLRSPCPRPAPRVSVGREEATVSSREVGGDPSLKIL